VSAATPAEKLQCASVSDRGLNDKRPLNEDSYLCDRERAIFAVADGVGGAEAGEVASQTAVDVLDEAFRHRIADDDDVEDLMELAIQRANASIHQMAAEHPRFSMMATTIVALHVDGLRATIGHVGDSRLYRVTPDGKLVRETEDHSIVEEEVRAGRMTPEQAANHPSKNVISRALGAEESVEVDMKRIDVDEGTSFLLCSDGITRHISDNELRELLASGQPLEAVCEEMKRRCYERGAEDNLTAVIVHVGPPPTDVRIDPERTVEARAPEVAAAMAADAPHTVLTPASRIAFPGPATPQATADAVAASQEAPSEGGHPVRSFFLFLLFIAVAAGAFYGGMRYQRVREGQTTAAATPQPTPSTDPARIAFATKRAAVDADPQKWLNDNFPAGSKPLDSKDAATLYLYGRALMLTGNQHDAATAFTLAIANLQADQNAALPLGAEIKLAQADAALKQAGASTQTPSPQQQASAILDELLELKGQVAPR
jgi:serine/threonine protein phosphatase PrpC